LLLKSSSTLVPCLMHEGFAVWDTLAIAEYLNELCPRAGMFPADRLARARCRSVSAEMHAGFSALRSSLPMNLRAHRPGFPLWSAMGAKEAGGFTIGFSPANTGPLNFAGESLHYARMSTEPVDLKSRYDRLNLLYQVGNVIHSTLEPQEALQLILKEAIRVTRASSGSAVLINPTSGFLEIQAAEGLPAHAPDKIYYQY